MGPLACAGDQVVDDADGTREAACVDEVICEGKTCAVCSCYGVESGDVVPGRE